MHVRYRAHLHHVQTRLGHWLRAEGLWIPHLGSIPHAFRQLQQQRRVALILDALHGVLHERVLVVTSYLNNNLQQIIHRATLIYPLLQATLHEIHQVGRPLRRSERRRRLAHHLAHDLR